MAPLFLGKVMDNGHPQMRDLISIYRLDFCQARLVRPEAQGRGHLLSVRTCRSGRHGGVPTSAWCRGHPRFSTVYFCLRLNGAPRCAHIDTGVCSSWHGVCFFSGLLD